MTTGRLSGQRREREQRVASYVARRVRLLRLAQTVTQEELAASIGVKRESMSRYESGERAITIALLLDIAAALQQPLGAFLPLGQSDDPALAEVVAALAARPDLIPSVQDLLAVMGEEAG